nr:hypothetical protein [Tanacetum cinerariifolium]
VFDGVVSIPAWIFISNWELPAKDAKKLLKAVEKRFGRNAATKKTQRNLLKQKYENFTTPSSKMPDQTFDRIQKLNTHVVVWRNKADLDIMSMDDLYNNLIVYEPEVKGMSSSSSSTQNMTFMSSSNNNTSNINGAVNTTQAVITAHEVSTARTQVNAAYSTNINNFIDVVICSFFASQPSSPQLIHEDLEQIQPDDMEEMDLRWQMAMLTIRARRFLKKKQEGSLLLMAMRLLVLISPMWSAITATRGDILLRRNFMPLTPDLSFNGLDEFVNKPIVENCKATSSEEEPKGNLQMDLQDQGVIDSGLSRHMIGNMSYLTDYEEIDRVYITFGGNPKGDKIIGKDYA